MSGDFSNGLRIEFSNLIDDIEKSLDEINNTDKRRYLSGIIDNDIKPLKNLFDRGDVLDILRSIKDDIEDFRKLETIQKREILSMLDEFIDEANSDFSATDSEENLQRSIQFSTRLQKKFEEFIGVTGTKRATGEEKSLVKKSLATSQIDTPSKQEKQKGSEDAYEPELGKNIGIAVFILVSIALVILTIYVIKRRKEPPVMERDEKFITGEIEKAKVRANHKIIVPGEKPVIIDEISPAIGDEISGLKEEIIELRNLVKEPKTVDDQKSSISDDHPDLTQKIEGLEIKVKDLMGFVNNMENTILSSMKTKLDDLDQHIEQTNLLVKEMEAKISKPVKIEDIDDIENPFEPDE
jgi:hypothetical protein